MTYTTYSAAQAATRARQYSYWRTNYCLNFVRNMLTPTVSAPGGGLPDARSAYYAARQKVATGTPPAGAPVYWQTPQHPYWHIAISIGGGYCRSTDYPYKGRVGTVSISALSRQWGIRYLGWSRDYAGLTIRGLERTTTISAGTTLPTIPAPPNYSEGTAIVVNNENLRLGRTSTSAKYFNARVWSWLYWHGGTNGRNWCRSNYRAWQAESSSTFGSMTIKAMQRMYYILDYRYPSGGWESGKAASYPGPALLRKLGLRADAD